MEHLDLVQKYGALVLPEKSTQEVLTSLQNKYAISQIAVTDMDTTMQSVFSIIVNGSAEAQNIEIFALYNCKKTRVFFAEVQKHYEEGAGVYIFKVDNQLYSNCRALEIEIMILRGISANDVCFKSQQYYNYLLHFQMFEKITHLNWKEYSQLYE